MNLLVEESVLLVRATGRCRQRVYIDVRDLQEPKVTESEVNSGHGVQGDDVVEFRDNDLNTEIGHCQHGMNTTHDSASGGPSSPGAQ